MDPVLIPAWALKVPGSLPLICVRHGRSAVRTLPLSVFARTNPTAMRWGMSLLVAQALLRLRWVTTGAPWIPPVASAGFVAGVVVLLLGKRRERVEAWPLCPTCTARIARGRTMVIVGLAAAAVFSVAFVVSAAHPVRFLVATTGLAVAAVCVVAGVSEAVVANHARVRLVSDINPSALVRRPHPAFAAAMRQLPRESPAEVRTAWQGLQAGPEVRRLEWPGD